MKNPFENNTDYVDSRDVIEYIAELESELTDDENLSEEDRAEYNEELKNLKKFAEEGADYYPDWEYGVSLIPESEFVEYTEELLKDCGDLPSEVPWYIAIDWEKTAENIKVDYTEIEYNGTTYLGR